MKSIFILLLLTLSFLGNAQTSLNINDAPINFFEDLITKGVKSEIENVTYQYENDYRTIVWSDKLIEKYKYSNEVLYKLDYELVKSNQGDKYQSSSIFRNCAKGIVIEVTEWYNSKLVISIQWYSKEIKNQVGYLIFCDTELKSGSNKIIGTLYDDVSYEVNGILHNENISVLVSDSIVKVKKNGEVNIYKIYQKNVLDKWTRYQLYTGDIKVMTKKRPTDEDLSNQYMLKVYSEKERNSYYYFIVLNAFSGEELFRIDDARVYFNYETTPY